MPRYLCGVFLVRRGTPYLFWLKTEQGIVGAEASCKCVAGKIIGGRGTWVGEPVIFPAECISHLLEEGDWLPVVP